MTTQLGTNTAFMPGQAAIAPLVLLLTLAAGYAIWPAAKFRATAIVLGGLVLVLLYLSTVFKHNLLSATHLGGQILFLIYVIAVVTRVVFRAPIVDGNILCGAASIYLLIGVLAGFVYLLVELYFPGSFTVQPAGASRHAPYVHADAGWLIYFSFTTLTTEGFGDVLPSSEIARSLSVLEAVVGQILLVVMMARLVGLHVAQVSATKHKPMVFETSDGKQKS